MQRHLRVLLHRQGGEIYTIHNAPIIDVMLDNVAQRLVLSGIDLYPNR